MDQESHLHTYGYLQFPHYHYNGRTERRNIDRVFWTSVETRKSYAELFCVASASGVEVSSSGSGLEWLLPGQASEISATPACSNDYIYEFTNFYAKHWSLD